MAATPENPIIFYDIASKPGRYWSFNTYKTRLTLSYKGLPYRVQYIRFHEIESTMRSLGMPQVSETVPHYTLPIIADPSSDPDGKPTFVSDSFKIAMYLDEKYPASQYPIVLPLATRPLQKIFIEQHFFTFVRPLFPFIRPIAINMFMDADEREGLFKRTNPDHFNPPTKEAAAQSLAEAREKWTELGQALELGAGSFVMGDVPTLADFAIGGILDVFYKAQGDSDVWREAMVWQDGKWDRYWKEIQALEKKTPELA
ncbi:glutathione S-transferase [Ceratobasidium sp. AG-Ba]|nr:glutathione S-transferase [Ceratobasidium sp. AG-Ba]QRW04236.1 glutathione S-transferase [Ceratobasidium sp. AG-Ba]